jgi:hypothetical protein
VPPVPDPSWALSRAFSSAVLTFADHGRAEISGAEPALMAAVLLYVSGCCCCCSALSVTSWAASFVVASGVDMCLLRLDLDVRL